MVKDKCKYRICFIVCLKHKNTWKYLIEVLNVAFKILDKLFTAHGMFYQGIYLNQIIWNIHRYTNIRNIHKIIIRSCCYNLNCKLLLIISYFYTFSFEIRWKHKYLKKWKIKYLLQYASSEEGHGVLSPGVLCLGS